MRLLSVNTPQKCQIQKVCPKMLETRSGEDVFRGREGSMEKKQNEKNESNEEKHRGKRKRKKKKKHVYN